MSVQPEFHVELRELRKQLQEIYAASANFQPFSLKPPILDSSISIKQSTGSNEKYLWCPEEQVPGLRQLRESVRLDLEALDKFLDDPQSAFLPPLSTNAPYLIAVWNELICARGPVVGIFRTFHVGATKPVSADTDKRGGRKTSGTKVDIVAENGRRWIRVNTIKNSRLLAEFREIDSYLTDDDSDGEYEGMPSTLAQTEFDNSVLRMGRSLLQAAKAHPIEGTSEIPKIILRLTRLNPLPNDGDENDGRIAQTINTVTELGIDIELGERSETELLQKKLPVDSLLPTSTNFHPTRQITLDLSALIALVSDLTHFSLPTTVEEAHKRFIPPQEYRDWKERRLNNDIKFEDKVSKHSPERTVEDLPGIYVKQARALTRQLLQEMSKGIIQELHDKLSDAFQGDLSGVEFWTTPEAQARCLLIVEKIGGPNEKRRVQALFSNGSTTLAGVQSFWKESRYPPQFIPLLPIRLFSSSNPLQSALFPEPVTESSPELSKFSLALRHTCKFLLEQDVIQSHGNQINVAEPREIQRAAVTKVNPRLTAHTVQSMLWGAELGWTTLTANKSSVKVILREIRAARVAGRFDDTLFDDDEKGEVQTVAALWVLDPRSLAEGMSNFPPVE